MWLRDTGFTTILSLLAGNHNLAAYEEAGMTGAQVPMRPDQPNAIFEAIADAIADPTKRVLVHADDFGDELAGILAGFLVHTKGLNPPTAIAIIEKITERPIGPRGCAFVPGLPPSAAMRT